MLSFIALSFLPHYLSSCRLTVCVPRPYYCLTTKSTQQLVFSVTRDTHVIGVGVAKMTCQPSILSLLHEIHNGVGVLV